MEEVLLAPGIAAPVLRTNIYLSVTGLSRCIGFDAYTTYRLLPPLTGLSAVLAVELPVLVEACGRPSPGLEVDVEARVWGPGADYMPPWLLEELASVAVEAFEKGDLDLDELSARLSNSTSADIVLASLTGSIVIIENTVFKLDPGYWVLVAKLAKRGRQQKMARWEKIIANYDRALEVALALIDDLPEGIEEHWSMLEKAGFVPRKARHVAERLLEAGALAATMDLNGRYVLALASSADEILDLLLALEDEAGLHTRIV